jgi:hypothetical protein
MHEHKHDYDPEEGVPYCEYLLAAKHALEQRLESLDRYEARRRDLVELIASLPSPDEEPGSFVAELPMTDADVKRAVSRRFQHSDGTPLTAQEEMEKDDALFEALANLRLSRALDLDVEQLNADLKEFRDWLAQFRVYFNQAARIQARATADKGDARDANRAQRRSRGRGRRG